MRLLLKNEVDQLKAKDRQREIDEGLKLSRKVDELRELQAKTEKELEDYKAQSLSVLKQELSVLEARKALIEKQLQTDRDNVEKERLLIDNLRRENVDKEKSLRERERRIELQVYLVTKRESELSIKLKEVDRNIAEIKSRKNETVRLHKLANNNKKESERILQKTKEKWLAVIEKDREVTRGLEARLHNVQAKEKELSEIEKDLSIRSEQIDKEKRRVAVLRETLERLISKVKKKHG